MPDDTIAVGDKINIYFASPTLDETDVEVIYIPNQLGESWRVKRNDQTIVAVQNFAKMIRRK